MLTIIITNNNNDILHGKKLLEDIFHFIKMEKIDKLRNKELIIQKNLRIIKTP